MLYISGALKIFLNIFRHKFTLFEGLGQDKMQKFTNTWIIESLVYFSHAKRDKMVIKRKQRRLMSFTLYEEMEMSSKGSPEC